MRAIQIFPDLHGLKTWSRHLSDDAELVVFLGDYMDSFEYSVRDMLDTLSSVIEYKAANKDKVVMLMGNHDLHYYLHGTQAWVPGGGFNSNALVSAKSMMTDAANLWQLAFELPPDKSDITQQKTLFTHAGVTNRWMDRYKEIVINEEEVKLPTDITAGEFIEMARDSYQTFHHFVKVGPSRYGPPRDIAGPVWCDFEEDLSSDPLTGYLQIVGHSYGDTIRIIDFGYNTSIRCYDTMRQREGFYEAPIVHL